MAKVSRPVIYTAVGAVVAAAIVFLTEPDPVKRHTHIRVTPTASAAPDGFTPEDLNAHFVRYTGKRRDVFAPAVSPPKPAAARLAAKPPLITGQRGTWTLTGINTVDGVTTALVENSAADDSVFLRAGDTWHGLHVLRIGGDAVVFQNALGQQTKLAFATTADDTANHAKTVAGAQANAPAPYALPLPAGQLAPMPIQPLPALPSRRLLERSSN